MKARSWDFPGGPVVKTLSFHCREQMFYSWSGNQDPTCCRCSKKQTNKKNPTQSWLTPLWALKSMISHSDVTQLGSYKSGPLRKLPEGAGKPAFRGLSISYGFCITLHELLSLLCGSVFPSVIWNKTRIARLFGGLKELKMQWVPIGLCKLTRS